MYQKIMELCEKRGMSVAELESKAGIGNGVIRAWETSYPRVDSLALVAKALGVSLTSLVRPIDPDEVKKKKELKKKEKENERNNGKHSSH